MSYNFDIIHFLFNLYFFLFFSNFCCTYQKKSVTLQTLNNNKLKAVKSMYLTQEVKQDIFKQHGGSETNTGSAEAQIALFTYRIQHLTEHMKANHKDNFTERSLVRLVGKRRRLLDYLKAKDIERYRAIIKTLNLRK